MFQALIINTPAGNHDRRCALVNQIGVNQVEMNKPGMKRPDVTKAGRGKADAVEYLLCRSSRNTGQVAGGV